MALDPSIALAYRAPQFENPLARYGQVAQIQNAQNSNRLADLQYRQALQAEENKNALVKRLQGLDVSTPEGVQAAQNAYMSIGDAKTAQEIGDNALKRRKTAGEITAQDLKAAADQFGAFSAALAPLVNRPTLTHDDVFPIVNRLEASGLVNQKMRSVIPMDAAQLPAFVRQLAMETEQGRKALEMLAPKVSMTDVGGQIVPTNTNTLAGPVGPLAGAAPLTKTQTPDSVASVGQQEANRRQQWQIAQMTDARAREGQRLGGRTFDAERGVVVNTQDGTATPVTVAGAPLAPKMSESAKKELQGIDAQANTVAAALKAVTETPDAFGAVRGLATMAGPLSETAANAMSNDANIQARSFVFNVVSKVINERAGTAQSAQELARLRSFLPAETDNAKVIESKLKGFESYLAEQRKAYAQPVRMEPGDGGAAPKPAATPKPQTFNAMPDPAQLKGKRIQADDGTVYKSDGRRWVREGG